MSTSWHPSRLFASESTTNPYALIILNQPINGPAYDAIKINAKHIVCADGGANHLYDLFVAGEKTGGHRLPDAVIGDLDSVQLSVREHFESQGVQIICDPDQYATDFSKCLKWLRNAAIASTNNPNIPLDVVTLGGMGGRVDQGFSLIHYLYRAQDDAEMLNGRIYLLSEQNLTFILDQGENEIHFVQGTFEENIGIIPVAGPAIISTNGLEWDVQGWRTEFGQGLMSTSNHIRSEKVTVEVEGRRPLFTVELARALQAGVGR